jgi:hypothetical protein
VSSIAAKKLAQADLLIANVQGLRGIRSRAGVLAALSARSETLPTLIIASSPNDVSAILPDTDRLRPEIYPIQPPPETAGVAVTPVARDRPAAEERFAFATAGIQGASADLDRVLELARSAWWAARQSLTAELDLEVRRFLMALERLGLSSPMDAGVMTDCSQLIRAAAEDAESRIERLRAATAAVLNASGPGPVQALVRSGVAAAALRNSICGELGVPAEELPNLGVSVGTNRASVAFEVPASLVVTGYFGSNTLDAILASEARHVHFVVDPIEARAAWFGARKMAEYLESRGLAPYSQALRSLMSGVETHVPGFAELIDLPVTFRTGDAAADRAELTPELVATPGGAEVTVYFTDGSSIEVTRFARFEVLGQAGGHTKVLPAQSSHPGDRVVLLEGDSQELFSDRRMAALDAGPLAGLAQSRREWLTIVQAVFAAHKPNLREVTRTLVDGGEQVDYATVRSWVKFNDLSEASTPIRWPRFAAFASAVGISLPEPTLRKYFGDIKRWRTLHRKAGRDLARAIRGAYAYRLSAITLARIEREWGLTARQLLTAARLTTVDSVFLAGGGDRAVDEQ